MSAQSKSRELGVRAVTGLFGSALVIWVLGWGGVVAVRGLAFVISFAMLIEFTHITFSLRDRKLKKLMVLVLCVCMHWLFPVAKPLVLILFSFLFLFSFFLFTAAKHQGEELLLHIQELVFSFFGLIYLGLIPALLLELRLWDTGVHLTILFFLLVWATDTGGYFVGKNFGKTKLYPAISPKKSVEGAIGGTLLCVAVAFAYRKLLHVEWTTSFLLITSILVSFSSQLGDLCESLIKRAFHKKDSGAILPGHGGFLDRFDGWVFSLPVMVACVTMVG